MNGFLAFCCDAIRVCRDTVVFTILNCLGQRIRRGLIYNYGMVSVVHSVAAQSDFDQFFARLSDGLSPEEAALLRKAVEYAWEAYGERTLGSGERIWSHALGMSVIIAGLKLDVESRIAAVLFAIPAQDEEHGIARIEERFGKPAAHLVSGISRLNRLRPITKGFVAANIEAEEVNPAEMKAQVEVLRKMLLAMVEDIRVVLLRLASRTQTLRYYAANPDDLRVQVARETLELYSPLANRLGVWELKWELEDLSFRFIHPDTYKKIAKMLDEKRSEREQFIIDAVAKVRQELRKLAYTAPRFMAVRSTSTASGTRCGRRASSFPRSMTCVPCASLSTT